MIRIGWLLYSLLIALNVSLAQGKKNQFNFTLGQYKFYNVLDQTNDKVEQIGLHYTRLIKKRWSVYFSLTKLPINSILIVREGYVSKQYLGKLFSRNKYYYFDVGAGYSFLKRNGHSASLFAGPSYAYGSNSYFISAIWFPSSIPGREHPEAMIWDSKKEG